MERKILLVVLLTISVGLFAGKINVNPGSKTIRDAFAIATAGDTLILSSGVYDEGSTITFDKPITIISNENSPKPTIKVNRFTVKSNFSIDNANLEGQGTNDAIRIEGGLNTNLKINNCNFQNFNRAIYFYVNDKNTCFVENLVINNCYFTNLTRVINAEQAPNQVKNVQITNSTFYKIDKDGYFINLSIGKTGISNSTSVTIDHCTFYNCFSRRGVYLADLDGCTVKNSIAAYSEIKNDTKSFSLYGNNSIIKNVISYNVDLYGSAPRATIISQNPLFVDAENNNLQLYANSPAIGAADDGSNLGDPRWGVSSSNADLGDLPYIPFKKPYTMVPLENSIRVLWQMTDTISKGVVYYGKTTALGDSIVSKSGWIVEGEGFVHVKEITGLEPNTTYYYQVGNGRTRFEDIQSTKTAPSSGTPFRIAITSDFHDNSGSVWQNMVPKVNTQNPNMFVYLGDIINYGDTRPWNSSFFIPSEPLLNHIPMIGAIGNHETGDKKNHSLPTTYYDYFSLPSHEYIDQSSMYTPNFPSFIDPRGESYYTMNYGGVKIISLNLNGDGASPSFEEGSLQWNWLDNQLQNSGDEWIFILSHVSVYSTGYHGQWSADKKEHIAPLLEKYAKQGKHILFFSGNCHNFEHLYKSGVNYIKPGVAASNVREQFNLADLPYSLYWKQVNSFSLLDVSADGETVTLTALDNDGNEFYSYEFTKSSQMMPSLYFTEPDGVNDETTDVFRIKWTCFDESGNGKINLYYSLDGINGTLIAENLSTDLSVVNYYDWNVRQLLPKGEYFIYGILNDGINPPVKKFARGKVNVVADITPPPSPTELKGIANNNVVTLSWKNPTHLVDVENKIDDFEAGIEKFVGTGDDGTGTLSQVAGFASNNALQINYNVTKAWGEFGGVIQFASPQNFSTTPFLEFWYKGDGSSRALRLIIKQDLDFNNKADDWWYEESLYLSSTEWKHAKIDLRNFQAFSWHPNSSEKLDLGNVFSIDFIIPSANIGSGTLAIDDVKLTGQIFPAPDFEGTKIVRRTDRFPSNQTDGDVVYNGKNESFIDEEIVPLTDYYYAAFAYDDLYNYSPFDSNAAWKFNYLVTSYSTILAEKTNLILPNIVADRIMIDSNRINSIQLFDLAGKQLSIKQTNNYVDVSSIKDGVYMLHLTDYNSKSYVFKLLKKG